MKKILIFLLCFFVSISMLVAAQGIHRDIDIDDIATPDSATVDEATPDSAATPSDIIKSTDSPTEELTEQPSVESTEDLTIPPPTDIVQEEETEYSYTDNKNQDSEYEVENSENENYEESIGDSSFSVSDRDIVAHVIMAESGNCSDMCMWLVGSTLLNLADYYKNGDIAATAFDEQMFATVEYFYRLEPNQKSWDMADRVLSGDRDYNVMAFRTDYYHPFGTPYTNVDNVYFSTY